MYKQVGLLAPVLAAFWAASCTAPEAPRDAASAADAPFQCEVTAGSTCSPARGCVFLSAARVDLARRCQAAQSSTPQFIQRCVHIAPGDTWAGDGAVYCFHYEPPGASPEVVIVPTNWPQLLMEPYMTLCDPALQAEVFSYPLCT